MNSQSIEKLRKKFIRVATLSFVLVMLVIAGLIYFTNLVVTRAEIREVLNYIISFEGDLPDPEDQDAFEAEEYETHAAASGKNTSDLSRPGAPDGAESDPETEEDEYAELSLLELFGRRGHRFRSPDFIYSTRYFAVLFDKNGAVSDIKTNHIAAVTEEEAAEYAQIALGQFFRFGSFGVFYYKVADLENGGKIVVYLDSTNQISTNGRLLITALALIGLGMVISFLLMRIFSYRVVRGEMENAERQKQFITNASHELKTPLAVIRANTEVEQMINGENEWNTSTMKQIDRMTGLIGNLVMIAKAEEKDDKLIRSNLDLSTAVRETAESFRPVAISEGKQLVAKSDTSVILPANEGEIRQLVSLLTDNAIKYCDDGGTVTVTLSQARSKAARITVSNDYAAGAGKDYSRFFDRFYREDKAHSVDRGGYGIGLSIAEKLVAEYHGSIDVSWKDGVITFTCILRRK